MDFIICDEWVTEDQNLRQFDCKLAELTGGRIFIASVDEK